MSASAEATPVFQPPGPGVWTRDADRFPRPVTRFVAGLFGAAARRGFQEATAGYGLLLDHVAWAFVHRWAYLSPRPVPALADMPAPPDRQAWDALVEATPRLQQRLATSAAVFDERRWRADLRWWDTELRPWIRQRHDELRAVDLGALTDPELAAHIDRCRANLRQRIVDHHRLGVAPVICVGDFLVHAARWTGQPTGELLAVVRDPAGRSPAAGEELEQLADALQADGAAAEQLVAAGGPGESVLAELRALPGEPGRGAARYLDVAGACSLGGGFDVSEPRLIEVPGVLLQAIRAAVRRHAEGDSGEATTAGSAELRAAVEPPQRATFDELLAEARASHRLRDERATHCDLPAFGLARQALLAAGRRLVDAGRLQHPDHVVDADHDEVRGLLTGQPSISKAELAERAAYREQADEQAVPAVLGGPPRTPVPTDWLPRGADRTEAAFRTYLQAMSEPADKPAPAATIQGLGASAGSWRGRARVVRSPEDLHGLEQGDVLVTTATTPAAGVVMPIVGAVVTDRGGLLSHAAIVAREYAVPAVVGTGEATTTIPDDAVVDVDGVAGTVTIRHRGRDAR